MMMFPFRARICPFQMPRFPFARGFVPFKCQDSLSRVDLSLSNAKIPFRADLSLSMAMIPFRACFFPFQIQKKNRIIAVLFNFI